MSQTMQIVVAILLLLAAWGIVLVGVTWQTRRACFRILRELDRLGARDPASAVPLPFETPSLLRFGLRDYRPRALAALVQGKRIARTEEGRYYLLPGSDLPGERPGDGASP